MAQTTDFDVKKVHLGSNPTVPHTIFVSTEKLLNLSALQIPHL